jgi:hypothetical protein
MHAQVYPISEIYKLNMMLFHNAFKDLSEKQAVARVDDNTNPLLFIAGHLVQSRCGLSKMIGAEITFPWVDMFARGATLKDQSE